MKIYKYLYYIDEAVFFGTAVVGATVSIPSRRAPRRQTILWVKWKRRAKTIAWTAATVHLLPPGGKRTRIAGVKRKKRIAA